jgi:serpin B
MALSALGMGVAFDAAKADFHAMCKIPPTPNVFIGEVVHKTYIDVNEKGTEAAAATSVGMQASAAPPHAIPKMTVDHPFFFAIRDNLTGEMLFIGLVVNPK